jgi:peptide/nickel transport system substrate-binding protein
VCSTTLNLPAHRLRGLRQHRSSTRSITRNSLRPGSGNGHLVVDALIDRQSSESDPEKRRQLVWEIERRLVRDASRPIIFYTRAATCWRPRVKGLNLVVNSVFNGWRFEHVWLDR